MMSHDYEKTEKQYSNIYTVVLPERKLMYEYYYKCINPSCGAIVKADSHESEACTLICGGCGHELKNTSLGKLLVCPNCGKITSPKLSCPYCESVMIERIKYSE